MDNKIVQTKKSIKSTHFYVLNYFIIQKFKSSKLNANALVGRPRVRGGGRFFLEEILDALGELRLACLWLALVRGPGEILIGHRRFFLEGGPVFLDSLVELRLACRWLALVRRAGGVGERGGAGGFFALVRETGEF